METSTVVGVGLPTSFGMMNYDYNSACSMPYVSSPSIPRRPIGFLFLNTLANPICIWDPNPKHKGLSTMDNDDKDDASSILLVLILKLVPDSLRLKGLPFLHSLPYLV
eukprot:Gb_28749 [translate_table: standard]